MTLTEDEILDWVAEKLYDYGTESPSYVAEVIVNYIKEAYGMTEREMEETRPDLKTPTKATGSEPSVLGREGKEEDQE